MNKLLFRLSLLLLYGTASTVFSHQQPLHKEGRYYYNQHDTHQHINLRKGLLFLGKKLFDPRQWVKSVTGMFNAKKEPDFAEVEAIMQPTRCKPAEQSLAPTVIWIGHSTFLIQINGFNILTDPLFGDVKAGPITVTKRAMKPGIKFKNLPHIDAILISHNHSDHTDTKTLKALKKKFDPVVFVPQGDKKLFESIGFSNVIENNWWDKHSLEVNGRSLQLDFLPAFHWSIRFSLASYRTSLWGSWMISANNFNIYFAGDTAYGPHFKEIAEHYPSINLALMPIGPTADNDVNHEKKYKHSHVNAKEAVDAFIDLNAHCFIPMHYGTIFIGPDTLQNPIKQLNECWLTNDLTKANKQLLFARCGQQYSF